MSELSDQSPVQFKQAEAERKKKEGEGQNHSVYTTQAIKNLIFTHGKKFVHFLSEQNRNY